MQETDLPTNNDFPLSFGSFVRAGLAAVPFLLTGGISTLWSEWDTNRRFQRVEQTLAFFINELQHHYRFDPTKIGEAEMHLLEDALQRAAREHRQAKRPLFAKLLAASWVHTEVPFDTRLLFQRALDEFEQIHMQILKVLSIEHHKGADTVPSAQLCTTVLGPNVDVEDKFTVFVPALNKLAAEYGFVRRRAINEGKMMIGINPEGLALMLNCSLSKYGVQFMDWLETSPGDFNDA